MPLPLMPLPLFIPPRNHGENEDFNKSAQLEQSSNVRSGAGCEELRLCCLRSSTQVDGASLLWPAKALEPNL